MLERGGGGKAPWWPVVACLREAEEGGREELVAAGAGSKWNERGARRGTKHVKNPSWVELGKKSSPNRKN
jgi:hypothetical protein